MSAPRQKGRVCPESAVPLALLVAVSQPSRYFRGAEAPWAEHCAPLNQPSLFACWLCRWKLARPTKGGLTRHFTCTPASHALLSQQQETSAKCDCGCGCGSRHMLSSLWTWLFRKYVTSQQYWPSLSLPTCRSLGETDSGVQAVGTGSRRVVHLVVHVSSGTRGNRAVENY